MKCFVALVSTGFLLGGCAMYEGLGPEEGVSADTVRARLGEPAHRYERNGTEIWEYDHGPYRMYGYHYEFNADHALTRVIQTRTEKNAANIALNSATKEDVREIIGWPVREYEIRGNTIWEWPMVNYVGLPARLVVQFADNDTVSFVGSFALPRGTSRRN